MTGSGTSGDENRAAGAASQVRQQLDVRGLQCPLPVLKTKVTLRELVAGDVLQVLTTDPASVLDFRAFCDTSEHELLDWREGDDEFEFLIRKGAA